MSEPSPKRPAPSDDHLDAEHPRQASEANRIGVPWQGIAIAMAVVGAIAIIAGIVYFASTGWG